LLLINKEYFKLFFDFAVRKAVSLKTNFYTFEHRVVSVVYSFGKLFTAK